MQTWKDDEFLLGFKFSRLQISREGFYGQDKKELWSSKLKRLLNLAGLGDIWSAKTNTPAVMNYIRQRLLDIHNDERKDPHQKKTN